MKKEALQEKLDESSSFTHRGGLKDLHSNPGSATKQWKPQSHTDYLLYSYIIWSDHHGLNNNNAGSKKIAIQFNFENFTKPISRKSVVNRKITSGLSLRHCGSSHGISFMLISKSDFKTQIVDESGLSVCVPTWENLACDFYLISLMIND